MVSSGEYNDQLVAWVRDQYGPGQRYRSARAWSIGARKNPNTVINIEEIGHATADVIVALCEAIGVSPLIPFTLSGWVSQEELEGRSPTLSQDEADLVSGFQELPEEGRQWLLRSLQGMRQFGEGSTQ